jgi:hypothetical protein
VDVRSHFLFLRARTHFRRYRGRRLPFSCFALSDSFSAVPKASCPVSMFCAAGYVFGDTVGVNSRFHVLHGRTHFQRYRGRRVQFSCFARLDSFSAVRRASEPGFIFCAHELVFGGTDIVGARFHIFSSRTRFWRYRGRQLPLTCFAPPDSFSAVPRASGLVFMFSSPALVFDGTDGVGARFHVLRSLTYFWRCGGHRVMFS